MKTLITYISILIIIPFFLFSCDKDFGEVKPDEETPLYYEAGLWVLNEGLFGQGNGEISFISDDKVYNNLFYNVNKIPLGDIPAAMLVEDDRLIITVNNSSKIYFLSKQNLSILYTIDVYSPRQIIKIQSNEYLVSSFNNNKMYYIQTNPSPVVSEIYSKKSTEAMILHGDYVFIANWSEFNSDYPNNTVQIFDINTKSVIDSIVVGKEPNSMVKDKNGKIWVLCSGGYNFEEHPSLLQFDPATKQILKNLTFSNQYSSPFSLAINQVGDSLFFIEQHIYKMSINAHLLPSTAFINSDGKNFYTISSPVNNNIYVSDVKNYQQEGDVIVYGLSGEQQKTFQVGINPSVIHKN